MASSASPWLKEFVLQELGAKILAAAFSSSSSGIAKTTEPRRTTTEPEEEDTDNEDDAQWHAFSLSVPVQHQNEKQPQQQQGRVVRILSRGQDTNRRSEYETPTTNWWTTVVLNMTNTTSTTTSTSDTTPTTTPTRIPNLQQNTTAWLEVTDGVDCVKLYFTRHALRQIYDYYKEERRRNTKSHTKDCYFGRGCCILLQEYTVEIKSNHHDTNTNTTTTKDDAMTITFLVSALESKSIFNNNNTTNHNNDTIGSVLEDLEILFTLQSLTQIQHYRRQQLPAKVVQSGKNKESTTTMMENRTTHRCPQQEHIHRVVRDWNMMFGTLSTGTFVPMTTMTTTGVPPPITATAVIATDDDDLRNNSNNNNTEQNKNNGRGTRHLQQRIEAIEDQEFVPDTTMGDDTVPTEENATATTAAAVARQHNRRRAAWERAKHTYGIRRQTTTTTTAAPAPTPITTNTDRTTCSTSHRTAREHPAQGVPAVAEADDMGKNDPEHADAKDQEDEEDDDERNQYSKMCIQNVLATQSEEEEDTDGNTTTTTNNDDDTSSQNEEDVTKREQEEEVKKKDMDENHTINDKFANDGIRGSAAASSSSAVSLRRTYEERDRHTPRPGDVGNSSKDEEGKRNTRGTNPHTIDHNDARRMRTTTTTKTTKTNVPPKRKHPPSFFHHHRSIQLPSGSNSSSFHTTSIQRDENSIWESVKEQIMEYDRATVATGSNTHDGDDDDDRQELLYFVSSRELKRMKTTTTARQGDDTTTDNSIAAKGADRDDTIDFHGDGISHDGDNAIQHRLRLTTAAAAAAVPRTGKSTSVANTLPPPKASASTNISSQFRLADWIQNNIDDRDTKRQNEDENDYVVNV